MGGRWGGAYGTPCFVKPLLNARLGETATRGRALFAPPRADEDPSWRYGHLQETRRTLM